MQDMNFSDVFGGPPRRILIQDVKVRYSFGETAESEEETVSSLGSEKPVFGDEMLLPRQHHLGDDFFDDIFRGDESYNSPRKTDRDRDSVFRSNPGSRILSSALPLLPKADPFATSAPTQFSLPAKLIKGLEIPTMDDSGGGTNGLSSPCSPTSLSRNSNKVFWSQDEYPQSPLSHKVSFNGEDSPPTVLSDQKENSKNSKKDGRNVDGFGKHFHFSIYKWAGREVPMLLSLVGRNNMVPRDGNMYDRSASSNGRIENRSSVIPNMRAREPEAVKNEYEEDLIQSKEVTEEWKISMEYKELFHEFSEPKSQSQISANDVASIGVVTQKIQGQVKSVDEVDAQKNADKKVHLMKEESFQSKTNPLHAFFRDKSEVHGNGEEKVLPKKKEPLQSRQKPLHALLGDEVEWQGVVPEIKQSKKKILNGIHRSYHEAKTSKKNEGTGISSNNGNVDKTNLQPPVVDPVVALGENRIQGKVRDYVQIFNQEADPRPKVDLQRSRSSGWKAADTDQKESAMDSNAENVKDVKADENLNKYETQRFSPAKTPSDANSHFSTKQENEFLSETPHSDSTICGEIADDSLADDFLVQELSEDHEIVTESEDPHDTKAIDSKIWQWSFGKRGKIFSLLSTLQFVLWPDSGWKPVPLADLIETSAVKRAYQKALLHLHPDKLQQKGASFHQKYIAEKVFDILQEAWDQFNLLVPI